MRMSLQHVVPFLLTVQHRMKPGLSTVPSMMFYEGRVEDGPEMEVPGLPGATPFLVVAWDCPFNLDPKAYPASEEAALTIQLWKDLSLRHPDSKVFTFYNDQRRILQCGLPNGTVCTIDSDQGSEWEEGIVSVGRRHGIGFVADRRRITVAMTRFKRRLIIVLNNRMGKTNPFWIAFRLFAGNLGVMCHRLLGCEQPDFPR